MPALTVISSAVMASQQPSPFANVGNSCFINSSLAAVFALRSLAERAAACEGAIGRTYRAAVQGCTFLFLKDLYWMQSTID